MAFKYKIKVYCIWEFGKRVDSFGNPHQEDSIFPAFGQATDASRLFILCDGMGGHDAGEVASSTVCRAMAESIMTDGHDEDGVFKPSDLQVALKAAYRALDEHDTGSDKKMGTTMTLLKLHNHGATIAHIGDSRVYHIRPGKDGNETEILFETSDHSLVNDLVRIGELTREEARHSKQKNVITRAMQPGMDIPDKADVHHIFDIRSGDIFYMCSDGMLEEEDMENGTSLRNIFSELGGNDEGKVNILRSVTKNNRDNHTAFIIRIEDVENTTDNADDLLQEISTGIVEDEEQVGTSASESEINTDMLSSPSSQKDIQQTQTGTPPASMNSKKAVEDEEQSATDRDGHYQIFKKGNLSIFFVIIGIIVVLLGIIILIYGRKRFFLY